ncbi:MAG: DNA polymerase III subunit gamma/tau [Flavobacteriales bacterium]
MSENNYLVSARKYRPQDWDSVVGQSGITQTLQKAISLGTIAQAYLFCGPRGVGKTTSARIFARAINGFEPDDDAMAFNVFELDAASNNKVEDIRSIVEQVRIPPQYGTYKVYIIDEVHMLSQAAFNAFLKTLEEPPPHAVFILATTEKHKILPTILSRCQIFDFHRITVPDMVLHLQEIAIKEGVKTTPEALHVIAAKADGALRDALSMFDQLIAFAGKDLTYDIVTEQLHVLDHDVYFEVLDFALNSNIPDSLLLFDNVLARGFDAHHFLSGLGNHLRSLMVCRDERTLKLMEATPEVKSKFSEQAANADLRFIVDALSITNEADTQYRISQHQRLLVELAVMKICSLKGPSNSDNQKPLPSAEKKKSFNELIPPSNLKKIAQKEPVPIEPVAIKPISSLQVESAVPKSKKIVSGGLRGGGMKLAGKSKNLAETIDSSSKIDENEIDESWSEEVTIDKVKAAWDLFVEGHRIAKRVSLVSTLTMCELDLKDNVVVFNVLNSLQEEQLNDERADLLFHLRKTVKNALLELSIEIIKSEDGNDEPKVFLTDKERYMEMIKKNPNLDELRKRLDLDLG